jgi:uncharacterized membrane protein YgcG
MVKKQAAVYAKRGAGRLARGKPSLLLQVGLNHSEQASLYKHDRWLLIASGALVLDPNRTVTEPVEGLQDPAPSPAMLELRRLAEQLMQQLNDGTEIRCLPPRRLTRSSVDGGSSNGNGTSSSSSSGDGGGSGGPHLVEIKQDMYKVSMGGQIVTEYMYTVRVAYR